MSNVQKNFFLHSGKTKQNKHHTGELGNITELWMIAGLFPWKENFHHVKLHCVSSGTGLLVTEKQLYEFWLNIVSNSAQKLSFKSILLLR